MNKLQTNRLLLITAVAAILCTARAAEHSLIADSLEWELKNLDVAPESRIGTAITMFGSTSELILFGGNANAKGYDDTWAWDGAKWTEKHPAHKPPALNGHAMAYDPKRNQIVMFGGRGKGKSNESTWIWDGNDWHEATPATKPRRAMNAAMAFNHASGRIMLFGGVQKDNSVWEWDGTNWIKLPVDSGPPPRSYAGLAFDQARGEMIMFGGITNPYEKAPTIYNDTWAWDGKSWREIPTPVSPSSRYYHKMEYHPELKTIILVGGRKGKRDNGPGPQGLFSDTWSWDGNKWTQHPSKNSIQPAYSYGMGYNNLTKAYYVYLGDSLMCATRGPKVFILKKVK